MTDCDVSVIHFNYEMVRILSQPAGEENIGKGTQVLKE